MRIEIFSPLPHGHQAQKSTTPRFGSEVKSICPAMRPPRSSLITRTVSGALPTFALSQAALRCCSKVARILSFLSTPNSAKTVSKRESHFHVKVPWNDARQFTAHVEVGLDCIIHNNSYPLSSHWFNGDQASLFTCFLIFTFPHTPAHKRLSPAAPRYAGHYL